MKKGISPSFRLFMLLGTCFVFYSCSNFDPVDIDAEIEKLELENANLMNSIEMYSQFSLETVKVENNQLKQMMFNNDAEMYKKLSIDFLYEPDRYWFYILSMSLINDAPQSYMHLYEGMSRKQNFKNGYLYQNNNMYYYSMFNYLKSKELGGYGNEYIFDSGIDTLENVSSDLFLLKMK